MAERWTGIVSRRALVTGSGAALAAPLLERGSGVNGVGQPIDETNAQNALAVFGRTLDNGRLASGLISTSAGDVILSSSIIIAEPTRIVGDVGPSYNRGAGKTGWLMGGRGVERMFDLGASRVGPNPGDHWELSYLNLKQNPGGPANSVDGISFTSRTGGPDRGATVRSMSFIGLRDAITIENSDIAVNLATLDISGCVFQLCDSAINAKGRIFGLRFVGNQCEQNIGATGIIKGSIDGPVTIEDNCLEGQYNTISLDIPPTFGNSPRVRCAYNYLEENSGQYVLRMAVASKSSLVMGPNYLTNILANDYVLIQNSAGSIMITNNDPYPVVFDNAATTVCYGSDLFRGPGPVYGVRSVIAKPAEIICADFIGLVDYDEDFNHVAPSSGTVKQTPFGERLCAVNGDFIHALAKIEAGDLLVINLLVSAKELIAGNLNPQIWDETLAVKLKEWGDSYIARELDGRWAVVSLAFVAEANASGMNVRLFVAGGTYTSSIAGIAVKNYGAHVNDGSTKKLVKVVTPRLTA